MSELQPTEATGMVGSSGSSGSPGVPAPSARVAPASAGLLTAGEVAALFRVDPKTVGRWARAGKLPSVLGPDGRRRYEARDVVARAGDQLEGGPPPVGAP